MNLSRVLLRFLTALDLLVDKPAAFHLKGFNLQLEDQSTSLFRYTLNQQGECNIAASHGPTRIPYSLQPYLLVYHKSLLKST